MSLPSKRLLSSILILSGVCIGQTINTARMLTGVNRQTGSNYTFVPADTARITSFNSAGGVNATLPSGDNKGFQAGTVVSVQNLGAGAVVVNCSGCNINGSSSATIVSGQFADFYSDGLNYFANTGAAGTLAQSAFGLQSIPPALPEVDIAADASGACPYNYSILSPYQAAKICNNGTNLGVNYFGAGFQPFLTYLPPSTTPTIGSIPQVTARGFEIVSTPWPVQIFSFCTGTIGAAFPQTYVLVPEGGATTCTSTVVAETPMSIGCTASKLNVNASAAGAVAGSGVVTVYKNGAATVLTCTLGTGTSCTDLTDSFVFNTGDKKSVRVSTGQGTDTTANVRVSFLCQ